MSNFDPMDLMPSPEERRAMQQETYETSVAKQIIRAAGGAAGMDRVVGEINEETGDLEISLEKVLTAIELPLWLVAKHIKLGKATSDILAHTPTKSTIWEEFSLIKDCIGGDLVHTKAVGLVFPWTGESRYMVFHNFVPERTEDLGPGGRWVRVRGQLYFIEHLLPALKEWIGDAGNEGLDSLAD